MPKKSVVTVGKKKTAKARATVQKGVGAVMLNSIPVEQWGTYYERSIVLELLGLVGKGLNQLDIDVNVFGGGPVSRAAASRVAIARGIVKFTGDEQLKKALVSYDNKILSGDSRQREPCKPNDSSARSKRQKSYR